MPMPQNSEEYLRRFHANQHITGLGLDVQMHSPCPFCAAEEFMVFKILDTEATLKKGATCRECGRSARAIFKDLGNGGTQFEIVQTGGDDPPAWLVPRYRREDEVGEKGQA